MGRAGATSAPTLAPFPASHRGNLARMNLPPAWTTAAVAVLGFLGGAAVAGMPDDPPSLRLTEAVSTSEAPPVESDTDTTELPPAASTTTPTAAEPTSTTTDTTVTTTVATGEATTPPDRSTVSVVVANAARVDGLALAASADLLELGYRFVVAADALEPRDTTAVLYSPGNLAAAEQLAADLGLPPEVVAPLGDEPLTDGPVSADVIVLLATDVEQ